jgi:tetratricopeptide (TPR) repeat protein
VRKTYWVPCLLVGVLFWIAVAAADPFKSLATRAAEALKQKDAKQAAALYQQALALRPSWAEGWFSLGASWYELREYRQAKTAFGRASGLAPDKGAVWAFLGLTEYQMGDYQAALAHFKKGEKVGLPNDLAFVSSVHNCAAIVCLHFHDFTGAVEQLRPLARLGDQSAITIETFGVSVLGLPYLPPQVPASKQRLIQLAGQAEWDICAGTDAAPVFEQLLSSYPNQAGVHYLHGIYLLDHNPEAARTEFERELQISPLHALARLQIAILDIRGGDAAKAIPLAKAALQLEPRNALAHAVLARAYMDLGDFAKAIPELKTSAQLAPENPQLHFYLGQAYRHLGRTQEAEKEMAEFVRLKKSTETGTGDVANY